MSDTILDLVTSGMPPEEAILPRIQMRYSLDAEQVETLQKMTAAGWQHAEVAEAWFRWEDPVKAGLPVEDWMYAFHSADIWYATFTEPREVHTADRWREILARLEPWEYVDRVTLLPSGNAAMITKPDWEEFARWEGRQNADT